MDNVFASVLFALFLFGGMLLLLDVGRRAGQRRLAVDPEGARAGLGTVDTAIFALLGLLLAFTFTGAATRFDTRRALIVEETNDIGTAWLRIDLLPTEARPAMRDAFRRYLDARIDAYQKIPDMTAVHAALARANTMQGEIWNNAIQASRENATPAASMLLFPALNAMFDITTTRTAATRTHPPGIIFAMLAIVALVSSLLAGYGMAGGKAHSWIHMISFAAVTAIAVYVILDLELPRFGLIRVENFDQLLIDLRKTMN